MVLSAVNKLLPGDVPVKNHVMFVGCLMSSKMTVLSWE